MNCETERNRRTRGGAQENGGEVNMISTESEVKKAMTKMKKWKAVGPEGIPMEAWRCLISGQACSNNARGPIRVP